MQTRLKIDARALELPETHPLIQAAAAHRRALAAQHASWIVWNKIHPTQCGHGPVNEGALTAEVVRTALVLGQELTALLESAGVDLKTIHQTG